MNCTISLLKTRVNYQVSVTQLNYFFKNIAIRGDLSRQVGTGLPMWHSPILTSTKMRNILSSNERFFISFFLTGILLVSLLFLVNRTLKKTENPGAFYHRIIFSPGYFRGQNGGLENLFDRNPNTIWKEPFPPIPFRTLMEHPSVPPEGVLYFQMELGLTHFPGSPPLVNPPTAILLWSGSAGDRELYRKYARPQWVHIALFEQEMVDVDREFRIPGPPAPAGGKLVHLPDAPGPHKISLDFLKNPEPSDGFPRNVKKIWLRVEILSAYPGLDPDAPVAIGEIDYTEKVRSHTMVAEISQ